MKFLLFLLLFHYTLQAGDAGDVSGNTLLLSNINAYNDDYQRRSLLTNIKNIVDTETKKIIGEELDKTLARNPALAAVTAAAPVATSPAATAVPIVAPVASPVIAAATPGIPIGKKCLNPSLCQKKIFLQTKEVRLSDFIALLNKLDVNIIFFEDKNPLVKKLYFESETIDRILDVIGQKLTPPFHLVEEKDHLVYTSNSHTASAPAAPTKYITKTLNISNVILTDDIKKNMEGIWSAITNKNPERIINVDAGTRTVTVRGLKNEIADFKKFIKVIDTLKYRIKIDVIILIAEKTFLLDFGINWSGIYNKQQSIINKHKNFGFTGIGGTLTDFPTPTSPIDTSHGNLYVNPNNFAVNLFNALLDNIIPAAVGALPFLNLPVVFGGPDLNTRRLNLVINAAEGEDRAKIVTRPTILATNNQVAKVLFGKSLPIYTTVQDVVQANIRTLSQLTYKDIGISIQILPSISTNKKNVALDIYMEVTELESGTTQVNSIGIAQNPPVLITLKFKNHVILENGQTTVISGLMSKRQSTTEEKIPYMERLPLIGRLFRSVADKAEEGEDFIFITPTILE